MLSLLILFLMQQPPVQAPAAMPLADFQEVCQNMHLQSSASLAFVEFSSAANTRTSSGVIIDDIGHVLIPSVISMQSEASDYKISVMRADGVSFAASLVAESPHYGFSLLHAPQLTGVGAKPLSKLLPLTPGSIAFTYSNFLGSMPALDYSIIAAHPFQYQNCILQPINTRLSNEDVAMVMNLEGQLVGIVWPDFRSEKLSQSSMSFFVPVEIVYEIFSELKRPWPPPRVLGLMVDQGLRVRPSEKDNSCWKLTVISVADSSVASIAGLQPRDELLELDSSVITSLSHFRKSLQECPSKTRIVVLRDSKKIVLSLDFTRDEPKTN